MLEKCKKKKNKKGQSVGLTAVVVLFVGIVVALAMIPDIFSSQAAMTGTVTLVNSTYTAPTKDSTIDLIGQELLSTPVVHNATDGAVVNSTNYTIAEGISTSTGVKTIRLTNLDAAWNAKSINVSYTYGRDGYIEDSGARGIANQIGLFASLAVLAFVLYWVARQNGWINF